MTRLTPPSNSASFFTSLVNALPGRVCILNDELKVEAFNQAFKEIIQINHNIPVQLGHSLYDKVSPENRAYWEPLLRNALKGKNYEELVTFEKEVDATFFAKITLTHLINGEGSSGVLVQMNDITEEKQNELNLTAFRQLASNLPNTDLFLCDHKMTILIADGGEMKKYGSSRIDFEGKNLFKMSVEYGLELLIPLYEKAVKGEASEIEYQFNGYHYKVELYPVIEQGLVKNIILVSHNISDLKNINVKLQQHNDTKDSILGIVAHDLRNPIAAILGVVEMAKGNEDVLKHKLSIIESSGNTALSIISDLLDISELGKETYLLDTEIVSLNEYIRSLISVNRVLADSKQIGLEFDSHESEIFAKINRDKFSRVLNNLLTNAIKFSHPQHKVIISISLRRKKVLIKVKDEGIGIPAHMREYIFDKFTRAGRRGTAGERSIGLGMSIVKQIVLLHKGKIWIESREEKGTTVCIELDPAV
ncbi:MAG: HAMP domain-containing sensor histidine kinase [Bacteroidota bacterium]